MKTFYKKISHLTLSLVIGLSCLGNVATANSLAAPPTAIDHPTNRGDVKMSKEYEKIGEDLYKVKVKIEAKDDIVMIQPPAPPPETIVTTEKIDPNVVHATVLSIDTSGSFTDVTDTAKQSLHNFVDKLYDMGDNMEISLLGTNHEDFTNGFINRNDRQRMHDAIDKVTPNGGYGIADYDLAFKLLKQIKDEKQREDKDVKLRVISLFDGDGYDKWEEVKNEASANDIDLWAIAFGDNNKENVKLGASKPQYYLDSTLDGISKAYETIAKEIKKTSKKVTPPPPPIAKAIGLENPIANIALDYGFDIVDRSITCKDGSATSNNNNIEWNIGQMSRSIPEDSSIKVAEMEYTARLNRALAHKNPVTQVYPSMVLTHGPSSNRRTMQYNENSVNLLNAIVELEDIVKERDKTITELNKKINELESEKAKLNKKIEELTNELNNEKAINANLNKKIESLTTDLNNEKEINANLTKNIAALNQNIANLTKEIENLNKEIEKNKETIKELTERIITLNGMYERYKAKYEDELEKNNLLMAEIAKKDAVIANLQKDIAKLTNENLNLLDQVNKLNELNKQLVAENARLDASYKKEMEKNAQLVKELEDRLNLIKDLQKELKEVNLKNQDLIKLNEQLKAELAKLKEYCGQLEKENKDLKFKVEEQEKTIKSLMDLLKEKIKQIMDLSPIREVKRYAGENRSETSIEISKLYNNPKNVIIVKNEADALTASMLARALKAPILAITSNDLPRELAKELYRLNPEHIYVIGGPNTISNTQFNFIKNLWRNINIERISGRDRSETSVEIAKILNTYKTKNEVIISNGFSNDSLIATGYKEIVPIIVTNKKEISNKALDLIKNANAITLVGGEKSLPESITNKLPTYIRISGRDRFETAVNFAKTYYDKIDEVILVNGKKMIDAISSVGLMKNKTMPILLSKESSLTQETKDLINTNNPKLINIVGGYESISNLADKSLTYYLK